MQLGGETQETAAGHKRFYRFQEPTKSDYPIMPELFSREPNLLALEAESLDLKQLGFRNARQEGVLENLRSIYCRG